MLKWIVAALAILIIIALIVPRIVPDDPKNWHVDPRTVEPADKPNNYLVADYDAVGVPLSPAETLSRISAIALSEPRVSKLAGNEVDGHVTYIQRSALFGFPDYISVIAVADENGSKVSIYSRSRFGHSDLGVNKARIERWLKKLEQ